MPKVRVSNLECTRGAVLERTQPRPHSRLVPPPPLEGGDNNVMNEQKMSSGQLEEDDGDRGDGSVQQLPPDPADVEMMQLRTENSDLKRRLAEFESTACDT